MASYTTSSGDVVYAIDRRCLHGAPSPASAPDAALAVSQLVARLTAGDAARSAEAQLRLLEGFVLAQPALARTPHAARILVSAAVDAFGDGNAAVCSAFLRAAAFLEAYGLGGAAFLRATHGDGAGAEAAAAAAEAEPGFAHFGRFLDALATREGVARELQARVGCGCFRPVPRGSAAAALQAAAAARASAESAAMPVPRGALASGDALAAHMTSVVRPLIAQAQAQARAVGGSAAAAAATELRACDACGGAAGLVCARCKGRRYCSRACQSADWPTHKAACSAPQPQPS
jgi:hypothetical protein